MGKSVPEAAFRVALLANTCSFTEATQEEEGSILTASISIALCKIECSKIRNLPLLARRIPLEGSNPSLIDHSLVAYKNNLYVFGGCDGKREYGDLYRIKLSSSVMSLEEAKGDVPSPRYGHTAVVYKEMMFVFGGWDGQRTLNDFYQYSFGKEVWPNL